MIFLDTNIIFSVWRRYILNNKHLDHSLLIELVTLGKASFCISSYVIDELIDISSRKLDYWDDGVFQNFLGLFSCEVFESGYEASDFLEFVNDPDDAQILADAIASGSAFLITNNCDDFKIEGVRNFFDIIIQDSFDDIIER